MWDSCGASAEMRRRSEEKLRGGEALDNLHGSAAERTLPQRAWAAPARRCAVLADGIAGATENRVEGALLASGEQEIRSCGWA
jgi:hypothetical protein